MGTCWRWSLILLTFRIAPFGRLLCNRLPGNGRRARCHRTGVRELPDAHTHLRGWWIFRGQTGGSTAKKPKAPRSKSSNARPASLASSSSPFDGSSNVPSPGSGDAEDWQRIGNPQLHPQTPGHSSQQSEDQHAISQENWVKNFESDSKGFSGSHGKLLMRTNNNINRLTCYRRMQRDFSVKDSLH